eukprot:6469660-Amphidinium_carterae.1
MPASKRKAEQDIDMEKKAKSQNIMDDFRNFKVIDTDSDVVKNMLAVEKFDIDKFVKEADNDTLEKLKEMSDKYAVYGVRDT